MSHSFDKLVSKAVEAISSALSTTSTKERSESKKSAKKQMVSEQGKSASLVEMSCQNCGAGLKIDLDNIQAFCPYCGNRLMIDVSNLDVIITQREKTRRKQLEYEQERYELELEEKKRPEKIKATALLAIIGGALMIGGSFAGEASGNPDSTWYLVSFLGLFPLMSIAFVWLSGKNDQ